MQSTIDPVQTKRPNESVAVRTLIFIWAVKCLSHMAAEAAQIVALVVHDALHVRIAVALSNLPA